MFLNEGLTRVHSQTEPRLHFGNSFALNCFNVLFLDVFLFVFKCFYMQYLMSINIICMHL